MEALLAAAIERHRRGLVAEAEAEYRRIIAAHPGFAEAHNALGIALQQQARPADAVACFRRAVELKPDYVAAFGNLGAALLALGQRRDAIAALDAALVLDPANAEAHYNRACAAQEDGALDRAAEGYGRAVALNPNHAGAFNNLGMTLRALGRLTESLAAYERATTLAPANPLIRYGFAQALLEAGDFQRGWREHEYRFAAGIAHKRHQQYPRWMGEDIAGRTILVWAEQGLGDTIQFCRHASMLAKRGVQVVLEVQPPLERLCRGLAGVTVAARGDPLPPFELQAPLMSLPLLMEAEPFAAGPYLGAGKDWTGRFGEPSGRRVALVWAGSPTHKDDHNRSLPPDALRGLLTIPDVAFYCFQLGQAPDLPGLRNLPGPIGDFADTAGALLEMDLLISVDTAVLHLAGALGRPAWALLPYAPDWRWQQSRDDSPWYPSLRLFRQSRRQDWDSVLDRVAMALQ
ncbi:hypothetical protein CU669_08020 [Paramagnetospirillum kuznetsovii]|uniref:Uncharacterized protein n=1 Tax=Paramagnetospirillum kuznetsovii TaxID=2053833 RepID=A0A364P0C9_9PROT|nr:tetratricopeptide repeat protein [Paramagnetospirillum kuznetsovii]RAU22617.1 hypothetical protein CU669_08020 [Paramagnetospirillum kuznetsovii]